MKKVPENPSENRERDFNALTVVSSLLVTLYLVANLMAVKIISIGPISLFDAGTITFPFTYMLGDVLAEVWGYRTARKVIILTFVCNIMLVLFTSLGSILPYPQYMEATQTAYETIFNYVPRIVASSLVSFLAGSLANARTLVWIRERQKDRKRLWVRTIGSSMVGYLFDTVLFVLLAFAGTVPSSELVSMILVQYMAKLLIEVVAGTPLAHFAIDRLERRLG